MKLPVNAPQKPDAAVKTDCDKADVKLTDQQQAALYWARKRRKERAAS